MGSYCKLHENTSMNYYLSFASASKLTITVNFMPYSCDSHQRPGYLSHEKKKKSMSVDHPSASEAYQMIFPMALVVKFIVLCRDGTFQCLWKCLGATLVKFKVRAKGLRTFILPRHKPLYSYQQSKRTTLFRKIM